MTDKHETTYDVCVPEGWTAASAKPISTSKGENMLPIINNSSGMVRLLDSSGSFQWPNRDIDAYLNEPARIRRARITAAYSQKRLAKAMGTNKLIVSSWETGRRNPNKHNLAMLEKLIGYTPLEEQQ